jgi:predicted nucleic acid-binding protein
MRVMLDANVLLDCLVLEADGGQRKGKSSSEQLLNLCDNGIHDGLVAWHTLPIVAYYHGRQHAKEVTADMMDSLLTMLEVASVGHEDAIQWREYSIPDFEDALQIASALAGKAEVFVSRNKSDFKDSPLPVMTPEEFLVLYGS